ncbi:unnamed protein product [Alopecurus aequalis]
MSPAAGEEMDQGKASQQSKEKALKADLSTSRPESTPRDVAAGEKKKPHLAMAKGKKPAAFTRVWSVEDEVRILERLAAFVKENKEPPARAQLRDVILGHLPDKKEFTVTEIYEKVRRLRERYCSMRATVAAGAPPSGDAEDLRNYELSREIWGDLLLFPKREIKENNSDQAPKPRVRREFEDLRHMYPHLTIVVEQIAAGDHGGLKRAFEFIDDSKARELNAKVKKQQIWEMKTQLDCSSLRSEVLSTLIKDMA